VHYALQGLKSIFREGFVYKKAGVIVSDIVPERPTQGDLFDDRNREKYSKVLKVMDSLNDSYGRQKIRVASQGFGRKWKMKNEQVSKCFTTNLKEVIVVQSDNPRIS
jgi:DNA polymerase V